MPDDVADGSAIPGWASVPDAYRAGIDALYAYQVEHIGSAPSLWQKIGQDRSIERGGVTFIRNDRDARYNPEQRVTTSFGCLKLVGGAFGVVMFAGSIFLFDTLDSALRAVGCPYPLVYVLGVPFALLFVAAIVIDNRRISRLEPRSIWVGGLFFFPDALVIRRQFEVEVIPKESILRFDYVYSHSNLGNGLHTRCVFTRADGGETIRDLFGHDSTARLEAWRTGA